MPDVGPSQFGVVIVEDEERARQTLRGLIAEDPDLVVLAETSGSAAPEVIRMHRPQIVLLDVQMPDMNGLTVLRALSEVPPPVVIFVTAHEEYALEAFEVAAIDYVLKPFTDDRLRSAVARAKARLRDSEPGDSALAVQRLVEHLQSAGRSGGTRRFAMRDGARTILIDPQRINWVEARGVYVRLHTRDRQMLVRESLADLAERLDEYGFVRIHRSILVNIGCIQEIRHHSHGDYVVRLSDGTELTLARTRKEALEARLGREL